MNQVVLVLNKQVADWNVLFVKLHNYHWNVKGANFFTLHQKFEELYTEAAGHIDEIAERVLTVKGQPVGSMKDYLELTTIKEATGKENAHEMVQSIIKDYTALIKDLKIGVKVAEDFGDETTAGLLLDIHIELEKHVWMLTAFLG